MIPKLGEKIYIPISTNPGTVVAAWRDEHGEFFALLRWPKLYKWVHQSKWYVRADKEC